MATQISLTLRPLDRKDPPNPANATALEGAFRLHISPKEFRALGLSNGHLVRISTTEPKGFAVAWLLATQNAANKPLAKASDLLREKYGLALDKPIFVQKVAEPFRSIEAIEISYSGVNGCGSDEELLHWTNFALTDLDLVLPGCTVDVQKKGMQSRQKPTPKMRVTIETVEPSPTVETPLCFDPVRTCVTLASNPIGKPQSIPFSSRTFRMTGEGVGGLSHHIEIINEDLMFLNDKITYDPHLYGPTSFLIHGPEGTGKSLLLKKLSACDWVDVLMLDSSTSTSKSQANDLAKKFDEARNNQPSLIVMDNIDKFLEKADALVEQLKSELATLEGTKVVVVAAARSIHDVNSRLRTSSLFSTELEIFPPNVKEREDIMRQIIGPNRSLASVQLTSLAERTHGFVGRDIYTLCRLARRRRVRLMRGDSRQGTTADSDQTVRSEDFLLQEDFDAVIDQVRPTVLQDSVLEVPKVRWTDIAGLDHVRQVLEAIIIRPYQVRYYGPHGGTFNFNLMQFPDLDVKFGGPQSRKGVLLYGPPGCAKTLIAQAVATESNQNFLAVKGSELIKMYVGESERAIRDVFRRARAAKPCIIFFDEMDSIGKSREKSQDSGLNVVTTLLNEMDGIEALKEVFIIGATNRPDILDSALIRPGRFDAHIHIGLPNEEARRQILQIHTRKRPLATDVDLSMVASKTEGSSGADIKGLCVVAGEMAISDYTQAPESLPEIRMCHFLRALDQHIPHTDRQEAARYEGWRPGKSLSASED